MSEKSVNLYWKLGNLKELELKVILDVVPNKRAKEGISKKEEIPIKGNMTLEPVVVEEANIEELVQTNQLLTNVSNFLEPSIISTDKVELIELPKDSLLPTEFRFTNLFILSDVFSFLECPNSSTTNTLKLHDIFFP